jgi:hypothetical protein
MAFVPIALMVASTAMAAYGSIQQGKTASVNAKAQQSAQNYNAAIENQNATTAGAVATSREQTVRDQNQQRLGQIRAAMAEGGSTNADVLNQSAVAGEMNALNTRYSGILQSNNFRNQSGLESYYAKVSGVNASQASQSGYWGAATDILGGASQMYGYQTGTRIPRGMGGASGY